MDLNLLKLSDEDRDDYINLKREIKNYVAQNGSSSFGWARAVLVRVDEMIGRENRIAFLLDIFGHEVDSSKDLSEAELFAICMWARPTKGEMGGTEFSSEFHHHLEILQVLYNDQMLLPGVE